MIEPISEGPFGIQRIEELNIKRKINEIIEHINKIEGGEE